MRILIVTNHFWPEDFRINELAVLLRQRGHEVTVLTAVPDYPAGRFPEGYGWFRKTREDYLGVQVRRAPIIPRGRGGSIRLAANYVSFALTATLLAPFYCRGKHDVVFVFETSPITVGIPACLLKWWKGCPLLFWVLDLWPESLAAAGGINTSLILRPVGAIVRWIYRRCDQILISSRGFASSVARHGARPEQIRYFPNWAETTYENTTCSETHDLPSLPNGFRILFAGNIGEAQAFPTILDAAERLRNQADIHWLVLGDGRKYDWVKSQVDQRGLAANVHLLGRFPARQMPSFFRQADTLLVTLKSDPIFSLTVPGKLQSYMRCGKPIIGALDGEGAALITLAGAGMVSPAENPAELAKTVLAMYNLNEQQRRQMGEQGKAYCKQHFDRERLVEQLETWMVEAVAWRRNRRLSGRFVSKR